jgi:hypothetical protein
VALKPGIVGDEHRRHAGQAKHHDDRLGDHASNPTGFNLLQLARPPGA